MSSPVIIIKGILFLLIVLTTTSRSSTSATTSSFRESLPVNLTTTTVFQTRDDGSQGATLRTCDVVSEQGSSIKP